jgi:maltose alpha-D-glucosyltransferase/alpha-amylase
LGKVTGDDAFDPEPVTETDLADWVLHVQTEALATLELLEHRKSDLAETVLEPIKSLLAQRNSLVNRINACISEPIIAVKTRYHGDFHLGQVLIAQNDFVITDFEGEPSRPFAERRHKHSPLRDVAGMLRSFNYAAHTTLADAVAEQTKDLAKFEPLLHDWEAEVKQVFLTAYKEAISCSGPITSDAALYGLLDLFLLEKALYEVRYELNNRPDWVVIPLDGILSLLQPEI